MQQPQPAICMCDSHSTFSQQQDPNLCKLALCICAQGTKGPGLGKVRVIDVEVCYLIGFGGNVDDSGWSLLQHKMLLSSACCICMHWKCWRCVLLPAEARLCSL